jgi:ATP-dependent protease HslVU (ClpYQ) ATPase subunit
MKLVSTMKRSLVLVSSLAVIGVVSLPSSVTMALSATNGSNTSSTSTQTQSQRLALIKSRGAAEITRRITSLNAVLGKITATTKLSATDKAYLTTEVNSEISGLTALQTKLAADSTLSSAITDAQSIFSEYRVYALLLPKIWLVATADAQQTTETKLLTLSSNLQTRITDDQNAGKNVSSLQTELNSMITEIDNAQSISSNIEQSVLPLQPSDYDSDHAILSGDAAQLKTAHGDNVTAFTDGKSIVSSLKSL